MIRLKAWPRFTRPAQARAPFKPSLASRLTTVTLEAGMARGAFVRGHRVVRWHKVELPAAVLDGGRVQDQQALAKALTELLKEGRLPRRPLVVGLPAAGTVAKTLRLPEVPRAFVEEAIQRVAWQEMPVPMDQFQLCWRELARQDGQITALAVAVPKALVEGVRTALRKARVRPRAMYLTLLAMAGLSSSPDAVIVQVEPFTASILVLRKMAPELLRSFAVTGSTGSPEGLAQVKDEVARALEFQQSLGDSPQRDVILAAPAPAYGEISAVLPHSNVIPKALGSFEGSSSLPWSEFTPNLGLALDWGHRQRVNLLAAIDLLPPRKSLAVTWKQGLALGAAALALVLLMPLHSARVQAQAELAALEPQLRTLNGTVARRQAELKQVQQTKEQLATLQKRSEELQKDMAALQELQTKHSVMLGLALQALPAAGLLASVDFGQEGIVLRGTMPLVDDVLDYRERLESSGAFGRVAVREIVLADQQSPVKFTLDATGR